MELSKRNTPEFRAELWKLIQAQNARVVKKASDKFFTELEEAIENYHKELIEERTYRDSYEALRDLFKLIERHPDETEKIRQKFVMLPKLARDSIMGRAVWRKGDFFQNNDPTWENLAYWAENCRYEELIEKLPILIATGRTWSFGQIRENGERSAPHVEPMVMGRLGRLHRPDIDWYKPPSEPKGGRPPKEAVDNLLQTFGLLWMEATGHAPDRKRGVKTPCVKAAEALIIFIGITNPGKTVKRFWTSIEFHKARKSQVPWDWGDDINPGP
jgi:hypothetical protein